MGGGVSKLILLMISVCYITEKMVMKMLRLLLERKSRQRNGRIRSSRAGYAEEKRLDVLS